MARTVSLQYKPRAWQRTCHVSKRRFTVLALHRRAGKTELAIMELIDKAIRFKQELGKRTPLTSMKATCSSRSSTMGASSVYSAATTPMQCVVFALTAA